MELNFVSQVLFSISAVERRICTDSYRTSNCASRKKQCSWHSTVKMNCRKTCGLCWMTSVRAAYVFEEEKRINETQQSGLLPSMKETLKEDYVKKKYFRTEDFFLLFIFYKYWISTVSGKKRCQSWQSFQFVNCLSREVVIWFFFLLLYLFKFCLLFCLNIPRASKREIEKENIC